MSRKPFDPAARKEKPATPRTRAAEPVTRTSERPATPSSARPDPAPSSREEIAMRAYLKWLERGCPPGDGQRDWLEAEEELRREFEPEPA